MEPITAVDFGGAHFGPKHWLLVKEGIHIILDRILLKDNTHLTSSCPLYGRLSRVEKRAAGTHSPLCVCLRVCACVCVPACVCVCVCFPPLPCVPCAECCLCPPARVPVVIPPNLPPFVFVTPPQ